MLLCAGRAAGLRCDVAKRIAVVASKFLGATAACVILLSFAAEDRKSHWNGCMKVVMVILQFYILALVMFLFRVLLNSLQNRAFFGFGVEIRFCSSDFLRCCA